MDPRQSRDQQTLVTVDKLLQHLIVPSIRQQSGEAVQKLLLHLLVPFSQSSTNGAPWPPNDVRCIPAPPYDYSNQIRSHTTITSYTHTSTHLCDSFIMQDVPMSDENAAPTLNTVSIEDFEKEHLKQMEARIQARREAKGPAGGGVRKESNVNSIGPSAAIPLDSPRQASQYMPEFAMLCQSKGISPVFDYYTPTGEFRALKGSAGGSPGFGAKVTFAGREISLDGPYGSKKEARDRVAGKALEVLKEIIVDETAKEKVDEQNWVGMLIEHAQALGVPYPDFQLFTVGSQFSCEVKLAEHPDEVLGSRETTFPSKKLAKAAAAKSAVNWLQSNGHFETEASRKKKKKAMVPVALVPIPIGSTSPAVGEAGLVQQILTLSNTLGLAQPIWNLKQNEQAPLFWDCSASFPNAPNMPDSVGAVRNVHGKKIAKEECARAVLDFLKEIEAERKERLAKLLGSAVVV